MGAWASRSANALALSGPSKTVHGYKHPLIARARPLHVRDRNTSDRPVGDCLVDDCRHETPPRTLPAAGPAPPRPSIARCRLQGQGRDRPRSRRPLQDKRRSQLGSWPEAPVREGNGSCSRLGNKRATAVRAEGADRAGGPRERGRACPPAGDIGGRHARADVIGHEKNQRRHQGSTRPGDEPDYLPCRRLAGGEAEVDRRAPLATCVTGKVDRACRRHTTRKRANNLAKPDLRPRAASRDCYRAYGLQMTR